MQIPMYQLFSSAGPCRVTANYG